MKIFGRVLPALVLLGLAFAAPTSKEDDEIVTIDQDFYPPELVIYTAEHDIVDIMVPLNSINFAEDDENNKTEEDDSEHLTIFFVEADHESDEKLNYKGLYVLDNGKATKILENGRDATSANDDSYYAYLGASDGIYRYDAKSKNTEKYGEITDPILKIIKENGTDIFYILTDDHLVYKVTDDGKTKTKVEEIQHAHDIVLDFENNLYFYGDDKMPYVYDGHTVKKIEGLPENPTYVKLIRPMFILEDSVPFISGNKAYSLFANGTSEITEFIVKEAPTAYGMEATLIQYFAHDKKIYEYNILILMLAEMLDELKSFLSGKKDTIEDIATRSRSTLKSS